VNSYFTLKLNGDLYESNTGKHSITYLNGDVLVCLRKYISDSISLALKL